MTTKPTTTPGTVADKLDGLEHLLADLVTQVERVADILETAMPQDRDTGDRTLRTKERREP